MTTTQRDRLYRRAYEKLARLYAGGMAFGIDRQTIAPRWRRTIALILALPVVD